jgi:phenylacetate-coenzyme A ligase PaaK-like adenylate-forming protein
MDYRRKLFTYTKLYDDQGTSELFVNAVKRNVMYHQKHCSDYAAILSGRKFNVNQIKSTADIAKIPAIPTLYLKSHKLQSMPMNKLLLTATSSGTKGKKSHIGFDAKGLYYGAYMVLRTATYHKLLSVKPTNYILLGYKPDKSNHAIVSKTAFGSTFFAPALRMLCFKIITGWISA